LVDSELLKESKIETIDEKERKQRDMGKTQLATECNKV